jgi:hypothetical protein
MTAALFANACSQLATSASTLRRQDETTLLLITMRLIRKLGRRSAGINHAGDIARRDSAH